MRRVARVYTKRSDYVDRIEIRITVDSSRLSEYEVARVVDDLASTAMRSIADVPYENAPLCDIKVEKA